MARRAIFLDRDGTLIDDQCFAFRPERITLALGAGDALRAMAGADYALVVVTNQSGVARGYFGEAEVRAMHQRLRELLAEQGVQLAGCYYCPHLPDGVVPRYRVECPCRKPRPGMLLQAARELDLDLHVSWVVGDIWEDVLAGDAVGCRTVLVGHGVREPMPAALIGRTLRADNLPQAAALILASDRDAHAA
ncbi:MAG: HAD family hydrolase [Chloroflexi bacterium]|nr:HAD family hydrolase [Chloroflexota bacterium]